jgi:hypothetical protein
MPVRSLSRLPGSPRRIGILAILVVALAVALLARLPGVRRHARSAERHLLHRHAHFVDEITAEHFQRGNLHTHSLLSDGTAPIEEVAGWYQANGYQFLAMTEHNLRVAEADLDRLAAPGFVVIPGEEVTDFASHKPLHVNALCARAVVSGGLDFGRPDVGLALMLQQIRSVGGTPLVNHPNFHYAVTADDIVVGARGPYLLEIWSGHPDVHTMGDTFHPSAEEIWDDVLAQGGEAFPAAVDDAHGLPVTPPRSNALPGRGWVETFGDETTAKAICAALAAGRLYASNGPAIARLAVQGDAFTVTTTDPLASVTFVGEKGETLANVHARDTPAGDPRVLTYRLAGGETLVRARVSDAQGRHAWTAAYRVAD